MKEHSAGNTVKKILLSFLGTALIGLGSSLFKLASFGNDPCSALGYAFAQILCLSGNAFIAQYSGAFGMLMLNLILFIPMLIWERKKISLGTAINVFGMSFIIALFDGIWSSLGLRSSNLPFYARILFALGGFFVQTFGVALFVQADFGIGPYDAMNLLLSKKGGYLVGRILTDVSCALIALIISVFLLAPYRDPPDFFKRVFDSDATIVGWFTAVLMLLQSPFITLWGKLLHKTVFKGQDTNI